MLEFPVFDQNTAPEGAKALLDEVKNAFGFVPNVLGVLAAEPAALKAYLQLDAVLNETNLSAHEKNTVTLVAAVANNCHYCTAAHSTVAKMVGIDDDTIELLRQNQNPHDKKLAAIADITRSIIKTRGFVEEDDRQSFYNAGFTTADFMAVLVGVTLKTLSTHINHVAKTELDPAFQANAVTSDT